MSISNSNHLDIHYAAMSRDIAKAFNLYSWNNPLSDRLLILTDVNVNLYFDNYSYNEKVNIVFNPLLYHIYDDYPDANKCSPKQQVRIEDDAFSLLNKLSRYRPVDVKFSYELNTWNNNDYDNNMIIVENIRNNFHDIAASLKDAVFNSIISNEKHLWIFELNKHINKDHPIFTEYKLEKLGL